MVTMTWWTMKLSVRDSCGGDDGVVCWWTMKWSLRDSCGGDDDVVDDEVVCAGQLLW